MITQAPAASSVTHVHLLASIQTEVPRRPAGARLRVLDAGCGNGALTSYLSRSLRALHPEVEVEVHGHDVGDHGVQSAGFLDGAVARLMEDQPDIDWRQRLHLIGVTDPWPFPDNYFDFVVSNQVLEHVADKTQFFGEHARVLSPFGLGFHLFPLRHYIYETHLQLPFVHKIRSSDARRSFISALSRAGMGKFRSHHESTGISLEEFSESHADYMAFWTNYVSEAEALKVATASGLRASFRYTPELYLQKLRAIRGQTPLARYRATGRSVDSVATKALRYISAVTLTVEKANVYERSETVH